MCKTKLNSDAQQSVLADEASLDALLLRFYSTIYHIYGVSSLTTRGFKTLCSARGRKWLRGFWKHPARTYSTTAALERMLTSLKDHITQEQWEHLKTAENPEAWRAAHLNWIKTGKRPNMKKLYRLLKDKNFSNKEFESALNKVFKNHRKLKDFSPEELLLFWYFLAGFVDGDGYLRAGKVTALVLTSGYDGLALFCWFKYLLGGRLDFLKDQNTIQLIFNQSNCNYLELITNLNGKLIHFNKIKGLIAHGKKFGFEYRKANLKLLASTNPECFNTYFQGRFEADGWIIIRRKNQTIPLQYRHELEWWLGQRITARLLSIEIGLAGDKASIDAIASVFGITSRKNSGDNTWRMAAEKSVRSKSTKSQAFYRLVSALCSDGSVLPLTIKGIRLKLALELLSLNLPPLNKNQPVVDKRCIDLLLLWAGFPMHNVKGAFERYQEKLKAKEPKAKKPKTKEPEAKKSKTKEPEAKVPKAPLRRARVYKKKP